MEFVDAADTSWRPWDGHAPHDGALLTPVQWQAERDRWPRTAAAGIVLPNGLDVAAVAADLARWSLIVLQFPTWTDGRAYSQARLLRSRHRYAGALRASGDIVADMLPLLQRAGFDSLQLRAGQDIAAARRALAFFDGHYQADATTATPRFNRHAA